LPGLIEAVAREHPGERVELWFMDEARVGQKGGVTHVWYQKGVRPRGVRQQGFSSAYLFGAVCPERGEGVALVLPEVSTAAMDVFLAELARAVPAGTHAALVLDGAGWHVSEELVVPPNLTLIHPRPTAPSSTRSSGCGSTYATAGSATGCSPAATRPWWTPPAPPGTRSWPSRGGCARSPTFLGSRQRSTLREPGIRAVPKTPTR
jgi:hypothetical protein